jgi:LacI family transcriptional regulator
MWRQQVDLHPSIAAPHVLLALPTSAAWARWVCRGFAGAAARQGWVVLSYPPEIDLDWVAATWPLHAAVLGPSSSGPWPARLKSCVSVAVNSDRSAEGIASVCLDETRVAEQAVAHLLSRGLRTFTTFRLDPSGSGEGLERRFRQAAAAAGGRLEPAWAGNALQSAAACENPAEIVAWLSRLATPCGIFASCDSWARVITRYAPAAGLRIPEDLAVIGVDNDLTECELAGPSLSSVAVPWACIGEEAAGLVQRALQGEPIAGERVRITTADVVVRQSSDTFAVEDALVQRAMRWIRQHAGGRLSVPMVAAAVGVPRQKLDRRFRRVLGSTVLEQIRRARIDIARDLLSRTELPLVDVAPRSGFTNVSLLSVAFQRELGLPPGAYRRRARSLLTARAE